MNTILFVTDLYYPAKGRNYYEEDLFLTSRLREAFALTICHPQDIHAFEKNYDLIVIRNAGPVANFKDEYLSFRERVAANPYKTYNSFDGKGDMNGKDYLLQLTKEGYPVIPTIDDVKWIEKLPDAEAYISKPKDGADSIGLERVPSNELTSKLSAGEDRNILIQPFIDFEYEVSFYFIDHEFQYALYAPDKQKRWMLSEYVPTAEDWKFANRFIEWNNLAWGIQRVDACRTKQGELLLVELEDLNPYLSLLELQPDIRQMFIENLKHSLRKALQA
ncbi:hypothetical protein SAMN04487895_104357 [Paenibacillus sophorae]|uniref:Glutathione synthase/RimK-type ligase, ATP-grasp superfamily n=1 Tax=Paenibacillus sophorae TaxID=1333845 RepID=A0A1H8LIV4_9BACL|nr:hypothetical protein [Paenibacillus sophorae]QWU17273.1 hypothetical protein KP014_08990 [Paenibacillus sophorae]SEO05037.1 hypothetical protein SAMN04487895_104357 [Paenibacillus sophorae]